MVNFRKITISSGKEIISGKSAENNEELIKQIKPDEFVLHTKLPGSPFTNIKEDHKNVTKIDLKEAAIFCAAYSQDWKKNKRDLTVHYFLGRDIYKLKSMKMGTFGVKKSKEIVIKKEEILEFISKQNATTN